MSDADLIMWTIYDHHATIRARLSRANLSSVARHRCDRQLHHRPHA
jgi:hypothetical protein